jgi:hypothetical protein
MTIKAKKESIEETEKAPFAGEETPEEEAEEAEAKKVVVKADDEEEEDLKKEEDEEEDEDATEKGELGGVNPEEDANASAQAGNTVSPNQGVPSTQDVFVPQSRVAGKRNASAGSLAGGQSPSEVSYTGKSGKADLLKSPLYVGMSKQIGDFQKAMTEKLEAVEKSFSDRIANLDKAFKALENMPVRKALTETQEVKADKAFRYTN